MTKKEFENKCFSPNWLEVDLENNELPTQKKELQNISNHKDLKTLLKELDEIKQNIENVVEKQHRLANLMNFYTGSFAS